MSIWIWMPILFMAVASLISFLWGRASQNDAIMEYESQVSKLKSEKLALIGDAETFKNKFKKSELSLNSLSTKNNSFLSEIENLKLELKSKDKALSERVEVVKEVPVEVVKEVEIIKEVEVIKEIPVEKVQHVIKEVEVIKEVTVEVIKEVEVVKEVEVIKEVSVEVPVEVIKEVEIIKEVPVEVIVEKQVVKEIIKEVPVEVIKEVEVEVIREVPIEIIKEVEVVKRMDLDKLRSAMELIDTVEVSKTVVNETRTKLESDIVERRVINRDPNREDNLKRIEGIGPKIMGILNDAGIKSFWALSEVSPKEIRKILLQKGSKYKMHNPNSWPKQAQLAAEGRWNELQDYQDKLNGGEEE